MPLAEFRCPCRPKVVVEKLLQAHQVGGPQFCTKCGEQMEFIPSTPAWFKPGKYGKAGNQ